MSDCKRVISGRDCEECACVQIQLLLIINIVHTR